MKRGRIPLFRLGNLCLDCGETIDLPPDPHLWDRAYIRHLAARHPAVAQTATAWLRMHGEEAIG